MAQQELTELLGKSILSEDVRTFMEKFGLPLHPELKLDFYGNAYDTRSENKEVGIFLEFDGYTRYKREYGEPCIIFDTTNDELILDEITIDNNFLKNRKSTLTELPFGLLLGDSSEVVLKKLIKKPYDKTLTSYGHCWWTRFEEFRILTALSPDLELIWVRIMKLTFDEKEKVRLKKYLSQQNKNISPLNDKLILEYGDKLPTSAWKLRKAEGDDIFTEKAISDVEVQLKEYLQTLSELTKQKKAVGIYNSIKKIVNTLNKINDKNDSFIETLEREELCDFINNVVRKTGLEIEESIDLTEEWREW